MQSIRDKNYRTKNYDVYLNKSVRSVAFKRELENSINVYWNRFEWIALKLNSKFNEAIISPAPRSKAKLPIREACVFTYSKEKNQCNTQNRVNKSMKSICECCEFTQRKAPKTSREIYRNLWMKWPMWCSTLHCYTLWSQYAIKAFANCSRCPYAKVWNIYIKPWWTKRSNLSRAWSSEREKPDRQTKTAHMQ